MRKLALTAFLLIVLCLALFSSVDATPRRTPIRPTSTVSYCQRGNPCVPIATVAPRVCNPPPLCDPTRETCIAKCYP